MTLNTILLFSIMCIYVWLRANEYRRVQLPAVTEESTGFPRAGVIASFKPYDVGAGK